MAVNRQRGIVSSPEKAQNSNLQSESILRGPVFEQSRCSHILTWPPHFLSQDYAANRRSFSMICRDGQNGSK